MTGTKRDARPTAPRWWRLGLVLLAGAGLSLAAAGVGGWVGLVGVIAVLSVGYVTVLRWSSWPAAGSPDDRLTDMPGRR